MQLCFANQADFLHIAEQKCLFDSLTATLPVINWSTANNSINIQSFLTFANAILQIKKNWQEVQHQHEAEVQCQQEAEELKWQTQDQDINMLGPPSICSGKQPSPTASLNPRNSANLKPGNEAVLSLLSQVDAALEAVQLADNNTLLPYADLQKHHDAIQLAAQQQLYSLNIALQTYRLILTHLDHLNKTLGPSNVECTGDLLNNLQVLPEVLSPF
ncbi:hypothetical protein E4T56_gene18649 [Termitomyces sp. T112]|nr:hypothetical protein E4T56_gene18649 [Termitomyces sp. T112]